jgi:hypothetical protein
MATTDNTDILTGVTTDTVYLQSLNNYTVQGSYMCVGNLLINFNNYKSNNIVTTNSSSLLFACPYTATPYSVIATHHTSTLPTYTFNATGITFDATTSIANVQFIAIGPRPSTLS